MKYYMVQKPYTGGDYKYNQYALLNLRTGYKYNDVVI